MAGVVQLWNEWEVQVLVLFSLALQVFLLCFAGLRRRNIPTILRVIIWLTYLLADSVAVYVLGHMSIGYKLGQHQQFMAFWASFFLVHLGGQDTITAYAMEDNNLWLRRLLTLVVQATGAAYVLYKYIARSDTMFMAAALLMFSIGVIKHGERVWSLKNAKLDSISKFLDTVKMENQSTHPARNRWVLDDEGVLQGAHELLYICMGQFVDYNIWPSELQFDVLKVFYDCNKMYELSEMHLSLMYDIFYTKAPVVHTWDGFCIRAFSLFGTVTACLLFHFSGTTKNAYSRVDASVTYVLFIGAVLLEVASVLGILMSTWTCATLKARKWVRLHSLLVSLRRHLKVAKITRKWTGSIGHLSLLEDSSSSGKASLSSRMLSLFKTRGNNISPKAKELLMQELHKMVEASEGVEVTMRSYRGQGQFRLMRNSGDGASEPVDVTFEETVPEFDRSILIWHFATEVFLFFYLKPPGKETDDLVEATKAISNYMMFLFVKHADMLPSPVRSRLYLSARQKLGSILSEYDKEVVFDKIRMKGPYFYLVKNGSVKDFPKFLTAALKISQQLLRSDWSDQTEVLKVVFRVWAEKLSHAAHHCSRDSHARRLNNGGEFITVIWLLTTSLFHGHYSVKQEYRKRAGEIFEPRAPTESWKKFRRGARHLISIISWYNRHRSQRREDEGQGRDEH